MVGFNTQPPEGSWQQLGNGFERHRLVSTHSRPKAAGLPAAVLVRCRLCFNTQPPEGGWHFTHYQTWHVARFNTQPPEGGWSRSGGTQTELRLFQHTADRRRLAAMQSMQPRDAVFQHTAARRRLGTSTVLPAKTGRFQHTAARRRLGRLAGARCFGLPVSTHSRPKAAGSCLPPSPFG